MPRRRMRSGETCVDHRIKHDANIRFEDGRAVMTDPTRAVWDLPMPKSKSLPQLVAKPFPIMLPASLYQPDVTPTDGDSGEVTDGPVVNYIEQKLLHDEEDEDWTGKK